MLRSCGVVELSAFKTIHGDDPVFDLIAGALAGLPGRVGTIAMIGILLLCVLVFVLV